MNSSVKHVRIVGAGPIGLYAGIQLKKAGVDNLSVIDPRVGIYTRPGCLNHDVFKEVGARLGVKLSTYSGYMHIKDLERQLYQMAVALGIQTIQKKFVGFQPRRSSILIEGAQEKSELPCDMVIDCTGSKRAVVHAANRTALRTKPFTLVRVAENPIKAHFIAYVSMSAEEISKLKKRNPLTGLSYARVLSQMQALGWEHFYWPEFYLLKVGKNKICIYCETPLNLSVEHQERLIKSILQAKTGEDLSFSKLETSKKFEKKPRFIPFTLDPHQVLEPVFLGDQDLPMIVIPAGDAQIEPDYRMGIGVMSGTSRVDALILEMYIDQGKIFYLDANQYQKKVTALMALQQKEMMAFYQAKNESQAAELLSMTDPNKVIEILKYSKIDALLSEVLAYTPADFFVEKRVLALINEAIQLMQSLEDEAAKKVLQMKLAVAVQKSGCSEVLSQSVEPSSQFAP